MDTLARTLLALGLLIASITGCGGSPDGTMAPPAQPLEFPPIPPGAADVVREQLVRLESPNPLERAQAAVSLGEMGDTAAPALPHLVTALGDGDWSVRSRAARSLGMLHDRRATEPLVATLADMVSHVREEAAIALGEIGDPTAEDSLENAAGHDCDLSVRQAAAAALRKIRRLNTDGTTVPIEEHMPDS